MRWVTYLIFLGLMLPSCSGGPTGPLPAEMYEEVSHLFEEAETVEAKGDRIQAIHNYRKAKEALEDLSAAYPRSQYFDEGELARVKDILIRLNDEERRGVEALIKGQEGPPPVPEPEMSGELYKSMKKSIQSKIGTLTGTDGVLTNDELDRVKRVEPDVVDNTPALVIHILTNTQMIEGMMLQQVKRELKEVLKVVRAHQDELDNYEIYIFAGFKAIEGAGGYAEPSLKVEYRFSPEDFKAIDWDKLAEEESDIKDFATVTKEP